MVVDREAVRTRPCVSRVWWPHSPAERTRRHRPGRRARGSRPDLVKRDPRRQQAWE